MCLWGANQKELLQFKTFLGNSVQYVPVLRLGKWPKGCCAEKHTWHQLLLFYPPWASHRSWFLLFIPFFPLHPSSPSFLTARHSLFPLVSSCWKASWCSALLNQQHVKVKSPEKKKKTGFLLRYHYFIIWFSRLWKVTTFIQGFKKEDREIIRLWISTPTWSDFILITFAQTVTKAGEVCGGQRGFKDTSPHRVC